MYVKSRQPVTGTPLNLHGWKETWQCSAAESVETRSSELDPRVQLTHVHLKTDDNITFTLFTCWTLPPFTPPSSRPLTSRSHPQLSVHRKAWSQLSVGTQGCKGRRGQIAQEKPCGSASSPGHAFCPHPRGWLSGGPVVPLVGAYYHRLRLHVLRSSGGKVDELHIKGLF